MGVGTHNRSLGGLLKGCERRVVARALGECNLHRSLARVAAMPLPRMSDEIEAGIRPVCDALNALPGVKTTASCEGHVYGWLPPRNVSAPYVCFAAPSRVATLIGRALELAPYCGQPVLCGGWRLEGGYTPKLEWRWTIRAGNIHPRKFASECLNLARLIERLRDGLAAENAIPKQDHEERSSE